MYQTSTGHRHHKLHHACSATRICAAALFAIAFLTLTPLFAQERAAIHRVPPTYPPIARQMGITGTVVVTTTVDATGKVIKADSTSGNKLLAASAIEAVKQWKFAAGDGTQTFPVSVNFEKN